MTSKAQATQENIDKLDFINILCLKGHHQRTEKTSQRMGEIFASHISDMGFVSRVYKELLELNNERKNNLIKNGQRIRIDISIEEIYKWHMK